MPAKPPVFSPAGAPAGVEVKFVAFAAQRPLMAATPRLQLVHTNAAQREGNITSAWNWAHAAPNRNTCPHYQIDLDGKARKMLPTDRVGIANATVDSYQEGRGDVREWSLAYETADTGTLADPAISAFTAPQAETLATILAYEAVTHGIPLTAPSSWWGAGTAAHTDPFGYPYWTIAQGKTCPGAKKKTQLREQVIPRARAIVAEWFPPPPPPPPIGDIPVDSYLQHAGATYGHNAALNVKQLVPDDAAWTLQKALRTLAGESPLPIHQADRGLMRATGPVLGPNLPGRDGWGATT